MLHNGLLGPSSLAVVYKSLRAFRSFHFLGRRVKHATAQMHIFAYEYRNPNGEIHVRRSRLFKKNKIKFKLKNYKKKIRYEFFKFNPFGVSAFLTSPPSPPDNVHLLHNDRVSDDDNSPTSDLVTKNHVCESGPIGTLWCCGWSTGDRGLGVTWFKKSDTEPGRNCSSGASHISGAQRRTIFSTETRRNNEKKIINTNNNNKNNMQISTLLPT